MDNEKMTMEDLDEQCHISDVSTLDYTIISDAFFKDTECESMEVVTPGAADYIVLASFDSIKEDASSRAFPLPVSLNHLTARRIFDIIPDHSSIECSDPKEFLANLSVLQPTFERDLTKEDEDALGSLLNSLYTPLCSSARTSTPSVPKKEIPAEGESVVEESEKGCKCQKYNCLSGYCDCLSGENVCGSACRCIACKNRRDNLEEVKGADSNITARTDFGRGKKKSSGNIRRGCKCAVPGCARNYCFCRKNNRRCSDLCECTDCENKGKPPDSKKRREIFILIKVKPPQC
eukprot:TRINITY_DN3577_c0_g2_i1.p1 TRINITY_DN3577_c0_g2~~TRINITY_DN3577_c0_g2_i1.p1  ORF type:complete len:291 (+),score=31.98 TRINITY_DN3577_c0_g2_i1:203-1075(+)